MRVMLLAFLSIAIISVGAEQVLMRSGWSAEERNSSASVRLDCAPQTIRGMLSGQSAPADENCDE